MSSPARARANRQNAKRSTGPRTRAGKARAARNALRHGLSLPVGSLPEFDATVTRLTVLIAGSDASPRRLEQARRVAEAEVDLLRVRAARLMLLDGSVSERRRPTESDSMAIIQLAGKVLDGDLDSYPALVAAENRAYRPPETGNELEQVVSRLADPSKQLTRLNRYERRALSRRKFAVRAMDAGAGRPAEF